MLLDFSTQDLLFTALIFVWTGFVRTGLGFGGAALGLPLMLFVHDQPLFWLPMIGLHLLFFSGLTLRTRLNNVDWGFLRRTSPYIALPALVGVFGLLTLPSQWLVVFIYTVTLLYAVSWVLDTDIRSTNHWLDKLLLIIGGYVSGTSLTGAPLLVAVYARNVVKSQLRNTLFVLWFSLVTLKLGTFAVLGVALQWQSALLMIPVAFIGHLVGLKTHDYILHNDRLFKRVLGGVLVLISGAGLLKML
jgi:uncharacterized membrane protein YfcA